MTHTDNKGFTLIELLVVIAIIGVLAAVVLLAINPAEMLRRSRDTNRMSDIVTLRKAVDAVIASGSGTLPAGTNQATCIFSNPCKGLSTATRTVAGSGWVPMNLTGFLATLPVEPSATTYKILGGATNTTGGAPGYYFGTDGTNYRVATYLESTANVTKASGDGGPDNNLFEAGTDMTSTLTPN